jgi:hypothetical protein
VVLRKNRKLSEEFIWSCLNDDSRFPSNGISTPRKGQGFGVINTVTPAIYQNWQLKKSARDGSRLAFDKECGSKSFLHLKCERSVIFILDLCMYRET